MSKYFNKKVVIDGHKFDSIAESRRYKELKLLEKAGKIKNLELQPKFLLQDKFKKDGKTFRKIEYVADFGYIEQEKKVIEDVKGKETEVFKIKRKMFEYRYPELIFKIIK